MYKEVTRQLRKRPNEPGQLARPRNCPGLDWCQTLSAGRSAAKAG